MTRSTPMLNPQILEEASDWFVEFSEGALDSAARERFDAWLRRSPEHVQAYLKVAAFWEDASLLAKGRAGGAHELIARVLGHDNVVPLTPRGATADTTDELPVMPRQLAADRSHVGPQPSHDRRSAVSIRASNQTTVPPGPAPDLDSAAPAPIHIGVAPSKTPSPQRKPRAAMIAIAASTLIAIVAGGWFYSQRGTYSTGTGETRSVRLEDGSLVELNSRSRIRVRYRERERSVEMLEGQAFFQVAKDATRPFIVHSDSTSVRAVGTQFDVYRRESGTTVTVVEGRVAVFSSARADGPDTSESDPRRAADARTTNTRATNGGGTAQTEGVPRSKAHRQFTPGSAAGAQREPGEAPGPGAALEPGAVPKPGATLKPGATPEPAALPGPGAALSVQQHPTPSLQRQPEADAAAESGGQQQGVFLDAGEQLTVAPEHALAQPHTADPIAATAWTQHKIILQRTALSEVAVEFNRYNTRQLVITDPSLANTQITGVFSSTDPDSLLRFLRTLPGVDVQEEPAEIRIARR
jgi:ferric-dicitrate binding protein FerR (iron transport regulator)